MIASKQTSQLLGRKTQCKGLPRPCRSILQLKAYQESESAAAPSTSSPPKVETVEVKTETPEWVPEASGPVLEFLVSQNFDITKTDIYTSYLSKYVENKWFQESVGWKPIAETINGRAAMLGFVLAALNEIFGQGPFLVQLSRAGIPVVGVLAVLTAATLIPIVKGTDGQYLDSLKDTYSIPPGAFTEPKERIHGRLAMVGLAALILLELGFGRAIL